MNGWLASVTSALEGAPILAVGAALLLGAASVLVSPCHLAGVPLVVGVVQAHRGPTRRASTVALLFRLGILLSFVIVGGLTLAAGRIAGDLGRLGNLLGAAVFSAFSLQLLDVVEIPWFESLTTKVEGRTARPTLVGFLFGASLGPCTFSFMAPALGVAATLSRTRPLYALTLLVAFAVAHTAVVTAAGVFGDATERFLDSRGATRAVAGFRRATGVVLLLGGLYFLDSMRSVMTKHTIEILGKGCGSCIWTERLVREVVAEASADVEIEKVTKMSEMVPYGIMSTPAIAIDERVVHVGGIPTKEEVRQWVLALQA